MAPPPQVIAQSHSDLSFYLDSDRWSTSNRGESVGVSGCGGSRPRCCGAPITTSSSAPAPRGTSLLAGASSRLRVICPQKVSVKRMSSARASGSSTPGARRIVRGVGLKFRPDISTEPSRRRRLRCELRPHRGERIDLPSSCGIALSARLGPRFCLSGRTAVGREPAWQRVPE